LPFFHTIALEISQKEVQIDHLHPKRELQLKILQQFQPNVAELHRSASNYRLLIFTIVLFVWLVPV